MSYTYKMTLKPLEPFFFGGEYTFGADESRIKKIKNKEKQDKARAVSRYSATSTQFPQQTALLGMLRKTLLIQNGNLTMHKKGEWVDSRGRGKQDDNYDKAKALVGTEAFSYERGIDLSIIESISPLFVDDEGEYFVANAKDEPYELKQIEGDISFGAGQEKAFVLDEFNAKKSSVVEFISHQSQKNYSDFFEEVPSVGIKKSKDGKAEEDAFFRKKSYYPKDSACFSFVVTFSQEVNWKKKSIVSLGADQSGFKLEIEKTKDNFDDLFSGIHKAKKHSRIVLTSETILSREAYELCYFVLGSRKSYRQLTDARIGKKSKRYYLLEKGSVLFAEEIEKLEMLLDQKHLQSVGINRYFTIKGN